MLRAWIKTLTFLMLVLFSAQTLSLSFHESRHAALIANKKSNPTIIVQMDDCGSCTAQHTQTVSHAVQLEPSRVGSFPPAQLWARNEAFRLVISSFAQSRAPPQA